MHVHLPTAKGGHCSDRALHGRRCLLCRVHACACRCRCWRSWCRLRLRCSGRTRRSSCDALRSSHQTAEPVRQCGALQKCRCELGVGAILDDCKCGADTDHGIHAGLAVRCSAMRNSEAAHDKICMYACICVSLYLMLAKCCA